MRVRANAWRSLTGDETLSQPSRQNEGGAVCMCPCPSYTGPTSYRRACVGGGVQCRQLEALKLLQRERERKKERGEGGTKVQAQAASAGPELLQSESPYRKKAGVISTVQRPRACTHVHGPQQNNTEASMSAQQSCSGSGSCLDLQLCAKNNKVQDGVGTDPPPHLSPLPSSL